MKYEKEITVLINSTYNDLHQHLLKNNFKIIDEYQLDDIYMVPKDIVIKKLNALEVLKHCILLRNIDGDQKITYKYKEYSENKDIIKQGKVQCNITDVEDAKKLFEAINYTKLIEIKDRNIVYSNNIFEIVVQLVNDKYIFIEMEDNNESTNKFYESIEDMIKDFETINIDYDKTNYFVKKAEIIFNEIYNN